MSGVNTNLGGGVPLCQAIQSLYNGAGTPLALTDEVIVKNAKGCIRTTLGDLRNVLDINVLQMTYDVLSGQLQVKETDGQVHNVTIAASKYAWAKDAALTQPADAYATPDIYHKGNVHVLNAAGADTVRINNADSVGTSADILIASDGVMAADNTLYIGGVAGGELMLPTNAGRGTAGRESALTWKVHSYYGNKGYVYANNGLCVGTSSPDPGLKNAQSMSGAFAAGDFTFRSAKSMYAPAGYFGNLAVTFSASDGTDSVWTVRANDGYGNIQMHWNSVGSTGSGPKHASAGAAYRWEFDYVNSSIASQRALAMFCSPRAAQGAAMADKMGMVQAETGYFGIGRYPASYPLEVQGAAAKTSGGASWSIVSDEREKENIVDIPLGLSELMQLRPVQFERIGDAADGKELGFIAQEVRQTLLGEYMVRGIKLDTPDGEVDRLALDQSCMTAVLTRSIQQLSLIIAQQEKRIAELESLKSA